VTIHDITYKPGAHNYKFWLRCLLAVCFCFSLLGGHPAAAAPTPVKVGYFYDADYMSKDDGVYKGYNLDYLYSVANYANWEYQFIDYTGFSEAYTALQKGEIDLLPSLFYSPERAATDFVCRRQHGPGVCDPGGGRK
jgi:ABC-type amino acid transport substrate-binding protein